uniref:Uncharacterized protein n=1 Tax=Periophthalmus magnuspinnatus TaxID=409849 RepID=A0A3B3ZKR8_9GOBI
MDQPDDKNLDYFFFFFFISDCFPKGKLALIITCLLIEKAVQIHPFPVYSLSLHLTLSVFLSSTWLLSFVLSIF